MVFDESRVLEAYDIENGDYEKGTIGFFGNSLDEVKYVTEEGIISSSGKLLGTWYGKIRIEVKTYNFTFEHKARYFYPVKGGKE